jgi:hypothetical protein
LPTSWRVRCRCLLAKVAGSVAKKTRTPKPPRSPQGSAPRVQAPKTRSGPSRTATRSGTDTRRYWLLGGAAAALIAVVIVLVVVLTGGSSSPKPALTEPINFGELPGLQTGSPPWGANSDTLSERLPLIGLTALPQEALAFHIHQHLELFANGKRIVVPPYIGIHLHQATSPNTYLTEIHTHDGSGIVHVESPEHLDYELGQLFGAWGVRLNALCLGNFKGGCDNLQWWVNGKKQTGNPAQLVLKPHQEIVISVGKPPANVPKSYDFPSGT